jgi:hypothetical protein
MFAWYRDSAMCYVYLDIDTDAEYLTAEDFRTCHWTYRGWTLQELIAPSRVRFYSRCWLFLGTRQQLAQALHETTKIHISVLCRSDGEPLDLTSHCVARKMAWAAARQTTRPEDIAYSTLGLFGVHLPPLYGEGLENAFLRLQHEILKSSRDLSILAWTTDDTSQSDEGALALTPNWFKGGETIVTFPSPTGDALVSTDNGLSVTLPIVEDPGQWTFTAMLNCRYENDSVLDLGITLYSMALHGKNFYSRKTSWVGGKPEKTLYRLDPDTFGNAQWKTIHITKRDQVIANTRRSVLNLLKFELYSDASKPDLSNRIRITVPPIGFWDEEHYILQIPAEQLEEMDICPKIWLCDGGKQVPLFTLSIRQNLRESCHHRGCGMYNYKWAKKSDRRSAVLVIDGIQLLLRVSIVDKGYSKGRYMTEVLLHFEKYHPEAQNNLSATPQENVYSDGTRQVFLRIK